MIRFLNSIPMFVLSIIGITMLMILMLRSASEIPDILLFPMSDKVLHFIAFGLVSVAIVFDLSRYRQALQWWYCLVAGLLLSILGIITEYLQGEMEQGRSADFFDIVADVVGAFIMPILFWFIIKRCVNHYVLDIRPWSIGVKELEFIKQIYFNSFPENERRPWNDFELRISDRSNNMKLLMLYSQNRPVGFITWWQIEERIRYVEHFCIKADLRGVGIGSKAICRFIESDDSTVVIEVEPRDHDEMACRRIKFYNRCGFVEHEYFQYIQPAYSENLEPVEMKLMSTDKDVDLLHVTNLLYTTVYGVKLK